MNESNGQVDGEKKAPEGGERQAPEDIQTEADARAGRARRAAPGRHARQTREAAEHGVTARSGSPLMLFVGL